jgi:UDP-glucuronate 4-epimerase
MQAGDMVETMADSQRAETELGFVPRVAIEQGLPALVDWCRRYDNAAVLNHGAVDA